MRTHPSGEGERLALGKSAVKARAGAESWLASLETAVATALGRAAKAGVASYPDEARAAWVLAPANPAQLVIAVSQVGVWGGARCVDAVGPCTRAAAGRLMGGEPGVISARHARLGWTQIKGIGS